MGMDEWAMSARRPVASAMAMMNANRRSGDTSSSTIVASVAPPMIVV